MKSIIRSIFAVFLITATTLAQTAVDEEKNIIYFSPVVVTANRIEVPLDRVSSSVTLITADAIEKQQVSDVSELLRNVSGVDIVRTGSSGKLTSLFMRGTDSKHTLVMLDGVKLNDPLNGGFDYTNLSTDNIKNIEIVRGGQSTLYGSEAIGGIINITTKKGFNDFKLSASVESGSFGTLKEWGNISGSTNLLNYSLSFSRLDTDGLFENDDFSRSTFSANIATEFNSATKLTFTGRISDSDGGTPGQRFLTFDPNARTANRVKAGSVLFNQKVSSKWHHKLIISRSEGDIDFDNSVVEGDLNPFGADSSELTSSISSIDWQNDYHINPYLVITSGVEWEERKGKRESAFTNFDNLTNTRSIYLLNHIRFNDDFTVSIGVRSDDHSTFGSNTNYRLTSSYILSNSPGNETKLRGSIGTGFRAPSINELFWPSTIFEGTEYFVGNVNLQPEESTGFDIAVEQSFIQNKFFLSLDYFENTFTSLISFGAMGYENIEEAASQGLEFRTRANLNNQLTASGNYTYLKTEDKSTGDPLLRRPKHSGGMNFSYSHKSSLQLNLGVTFVGERFDSDFSSFPAVYEFIPSHKTFRIASSYKLSENVRLNFKIENLLDEEYSEVAGYPSPGRAVYGGITLNL